MINFIRDKIYNFFGVNEIKERQNKILINQGKIINSINSNLNKKNINDFEYRIFSQFGEDGIIQYLINNLKIEKKIFVEFGVENYEEANTRFLLENNNWKGLIIDSSRENIKFIKQQQYFWKNNISAINEFIKVENINEILKKNKIIGKIGLLSIDVDGNDYWIWEGITQIEPDIVVIEYNSRFGNDRSVTIPYDPKFVRGKENSILYFGASLKALKKLGSSKGYELFCTNLNGNNAFFVKKELINEKLLKERNLDSFHDKTFMETKNDKDFNLNDYPLIEV
tara:strand:+ start:4048 stop:4893 length:846 start_codon:yes stop_codon:yes gene_type:complete